MTQAFKPPVFKPKSEVKTIGSGGQIYFSKKMAGQHVVVTEERPGYWTVKTADVIPHDEKWLHEPGVQERIARGLEWARTTPFKETTLEEIEERIRQLESD